VKFDTYKPEPMTIETPPEPRSINRPLFVKSDNFQKVLGRIKTAKESLKSCEDHLYAINDMKAKEDNKLKLWKSKLEDIQRKLIYVDKSLFENEG
jgi:hypothetical protein